MASIAEYINSIHDPVEKRALQKIFEDIGEVIPDDSLKQKKFDRDYTLEEFESCPVVASKDTGGAPTYSSMKALLDELHDDHATFKTVVDELKTWAQTLATKLNADTGVADTDYDTTITASAPATLTAGKPSTAAGDENLLIFDDNIFEYHILGTQTIPAPVRTSTGLNIGMDQTNNDGIELTQGILANSRQAFVVGTSEPFFLKVNFTIPDVSGTDDCAVGFRKAEAYQGNIDDYDEMACLNVISGNIKIETILNGGATTTTDTTDDWADGETHTLEVYIDSNGAATYKIDGVAPSTTAAFSFDSDETVIPFMYFLHSSDVAGAVTIRSWECGIQ